MKKVLMSVAVMMTMAQAEDVVHYDKNTKDEQTMSKPNHPSTDAQVNYDKAENKKEKK